MNGVNLADQGRAECPMIQSGLELIVHGCHAGTGYLTLRYAIVAKIYDAEKHFNKTKRDGLQKRTLFGRRWLY